MMEVEQLPQQLKVKINENFHYFILNCDIIEISVST